MQDCMEAVCTRLPLQDNYFWQVYVRGAYTPSCCPEYLKPENFARLKAGLANRISIHTCSLTHFLETHDVPISRVILLDHMDWLSTFDYPALQQEWQAIVRRAVPNTRILWRSGGLRVEYVDPLEVRVAGQRCHVGALLTYDRRLAAELHAQDRVHTYGSFYIAELQAA
jgi:S-adenosylmethionine-diacylglycerol 3-amino-3-carboxypropyl transferase